MADKICIVTGGSSGYGKETARLLAAQGDKVIITGKDEEKLRIAQEEIGADAYFAADITNYSDWEKLREFVIEKYGRLDLLDNNAGAAVTIKPMSEQTVKQLDDCIAINLIGAMYGCKAFVDLFIKQKSGTIINIASVCAEHAWPGFTAYTAAKFGILGLSKSLYTELRPHNIRVTCMIPASSNTGFREAAGLAPAERVMKPSDFARTVVEVFNLPQHVIVEKATVWGMDQECIPL